MVFGLNLLEGLLSLFPHDLAVPPYPGQPCFHVTIVITLLDHVAPGGWWSLCYGPHLRQPASKMLLKRQLGSLRCEA